MLCVFLQSSVSLYATTTSFAEKHIAGNPPSEYWYSFLCEGCICTESLHSHCNSISSSTYCCACLPFIFSEYVYIQYILISLSGSCLGGTPTAEWNILNTRFSCFVRSFWLSHCQLQRTYSSVKGAHYHMTKVQNFDQFHLMEEAIRNRQMLCKIMCTLNLKYFIRRTCFHSQTWTSVCSVSNCTSCLF